MSRIPNWFERKFEFSFPVELYPNLCVRLRGTPARIEEIIRGKLLTEFRTARTRLVDRAESLDSVLFKRSISHPRLKKPMRLVDHLYFAAEHDDHHLARIWE